MDATIWDCELTQAGVSLSNFQRQTMTELYSGRARMVSHGVVGRPRVAIGRRMPGLVLVSVLALLPWVGSICASL